MSYINLCPLSTGKIRGLIPYQPQYKYQEQIEDGEANISQCHHCDTQLRQVIRVYSWISISKKRVISLQVHTFDELFRINARRDQLRCQVLKGRLNNSSVYLGPRRSCCKFRLFFFSIFLWTSLASSVILLTTDLLPLLFFATFFFLTGFFIVWLVSKRKRTIGDSTE